MAQVEALLPLPHSVRNPQATAEVEPSHEEQSQVGETLDQVA